VPIVSHFNPGEAANTWCPVLFLDYTINRLPERPSPHSSREFLDVVLGHVTDTQQHGHDFYLLGTGLGVWDNSFATTLQYTNPPRRDVAMLPAPGGPPGGGPPPSGGWLVIAFLTDNPGEWLPSNMAVNIPAN
jgi:hypothetical protein